MEKACPCALAWSLLQRWDHHCDISARHLRRVPRIQDSLLVLSLTILFIRIFQTNVFQAGFLELLYERFRWSVIVAMVYLALTIGLQAWILVVHWNDPLKYSWPALLGLLFTLQRSMSCLHYYFYKRSVLCLTDPRLYDDAWIGQRLQETK